MGVLKQGSRGPDVAELKNRLEQLGYYGLNNDDIFGSGTDGCVRHFQSQWGLNADGKVGNDTWEALDQAANEGWQQQSYDGGGGGGGGHSRGGHSSSGVMKRGSRGDNVFDLQEKLQQLGYSISVDGKYGPDTYGAVCHFQYNHGLTIDGKVGGNTFSTIESALFDQQWQAQDYDPNYWENYETDGSSDDGGYEEGSDEEQYDEE